jgi:hypothetical protein
MFIVMANEGIEKIIVNHDTKWTPSTTTNNQRVSCLMSEIVDKEIDTSACAVEEKEGVRCSSTGTLPSRRQTSQPDIKTPCSNGQTVLTNKRKTCSRRP